MVASLDGRWGSDIGRPRLVAGRLPDATRADEILVSERLAMLEDLHVGDHIDGVLLTSLRPRRLWVLSRRPIRAIPSV